MKCYVSHLRLACLGLVAFTLSSTPDRAIAQSSGSIFATRAELEQLLASQTAGSGVATDEQQLGAYVSAASVRQRLEEGDLQPGDEIQVFVEGYPDLSRTFIVEPSRTIIFPEIGPVSLRGVLRSELQEHLTQSLARYIRNPIVRTESTIRVVVLGAVGNPGYYSVKPHAQVTDVLQAAGGTTSKARLMRMRVERGSTGNRVIAGDQLHQAVIAGRSLDQLGIQAGDQIVVPEQPTMGPVRQALAWTSAVGSVVWLAMRIRRW
jgi:protein involved in polysaccharide export with SLBB domain